MGKNTLERRVAALEAEIERLKGSAPAAAAGGTPWWEQIAGVFGGEATFDRAMRLGQAYRRSLRPEPVSTRKRRGAAGSIG